MSDCKGLETAEILQLSPQCAACPEQASLSRLYFNLGHISFHLNAMGEDLIGEPGQEFDEFVAEEFPPEIASLITSFTRRSLSEELDDVDTEKQHTKEESEALTRACDGVLKMKAAKGDVEYVVAVCTSARAHLRDSEQPQQTMTSVWVRSKSSH